MASDGSSGGSRILQILLGIVVVALTAFLIYVVVKPGFDQAERQRKASMVHERMEDIRTALIAHRDSIGSFPGTLDSLAMWIRSDSAFVGQELSAVFAHEEGRMTPLSLDSLTISPISGEPFVYVVNDTSDVDVYWLQSPDNPADSIGTHLPDPGLRNAASWDV